MKHRIYLRLLAFKNRVLRALSRSYRDHERIVCQLEEARYERNSAEAKLRNLQVEFDATRERLRQAIEAQENATQQLISERALRQAAYELAAQYHEQLVDVMKHTTDWFAIGSVVRRPMFGMWPVPPPVQEPAKPAAPLHSKRMAREFANEQTQKTWEEILKDMRETPQEGPEFTTQ